MKSRDSSVEQRQRQTLRVFGRFIYNVLQKRSDFEYVIFHLNYSFTGIFHGLLMDESECGVRLRTSAEYGRSDCIY